MKSQEAELLLSKHGIDMIIYVNVIGDNIVHDYIEKYKDWKPGDKVRLIASAENMSLSEEEMLEYDQLINRELTIDYFYNVGAMVLCEFDYGVNMNHFEKIS